MSTPKSLVQSVKRFVKLHLGNCAFAPFTGADYALFSAFAHLVEAWSYGAGEEDCIAAMTHVVRSAQPRLSVLTCFVQAIPAVCDWPHVAKLWPRIVGDLWIVDARCNARDLCAIERRDERPSVHHGVGKPYDGSVVGAEGAP